MSKWRICLMDNEMTVLDEYTTTDVSDFISVVEKVRADIVGGNVPPNTEAVSIIPEEQA